MKQKQIVISTAFLVVLGLGCIDTRDLRPNIPWQRCKTDPCADNCAADLRKTYCEYYFDDPKCTRCWDSSWSPSRADDGGADGSSEDGSAGEASSPECRQAAECSIDKPACRDGKCVACTTDGDCVGRTGRPSCDVTSGACVECTGTSHAVCDAKGSVCKTGGLVCVQCNDNTDCDEGAPHCGAENTCGKCVSDADCASWNKICDAGQCVQCTGTNTTQCGGDICDSTDRTCEVGVKPASADLCESCVSDAQCVAGALCMPTSFDGTDTGYACLPKRDSVPGMQGSCLSDRRPYVSTLNAGVGDPVASIDGVTVPVCQLRVTTCQALNDFSTKSCAGTGDSASCGSPLLDDGVCAPVPADTIFRCSVPCGSKEDCKRGFACTGSGYCSL